jgi:DDE superfamily endonuclease
MDGSMVIILAMYSFLHQMEHDSDVFQMAGLYHKLEIAYEATGGKCLMDSAFQKHRYVIKTGRQPPPDATDRQRRIAAEATSMCQSAEWGMRAFQSAFPKLKIPIEYEERGERKIILKVAVLLYNWRANTVGLNQIRTTFMPHLDQDLHNLFGIQY